MPDVVVLGSAFRFPGAGDPDRFWELLRAGTCTVRRDSNNVGSAVGGTVSAYGRLDGIAEFDAGLFGYSPREATDIDPQQRLLLECAIEALDRSCVPTRGVHDIGVFASVGLCSYLLNTWDGGGTGALELAQMIGSDGHYAATRIAYKLGLHGPAMSVGTACSSSLLAVHLASLSILGGECDVALAGGMDVEYPQPSGYAYQKGSILSPDGVCRPFDRSAQGTVFGSGGGLVVLADRETAERNGWPVTCVLRGSAVNNDGASKASFTAPSSDRQGAVVAQALAVAGLQPEDVDVVECHGTGTRLGDQAELEALGGVFAGRGSPYLGSVKANIGHLRVGAGVAGFVKACTMASTGVVPPLANLQEPLAEVEKLGFRLPREEVRLGRPGGRPVAVGVSSFGFGGTNVHAVVTGLPPQRSAGPARGGGTARQRRQGPVVVPLAASTPEACATTARAVASSVEDHEPADIAHTLSRGRDARGAYRLAVVADTPEELRRALEGEFADSDETLLAEGWTSPSRWQSLWVVPGQASVDLDRVEQLAGWDPDFTSAVEACRAALRAGVAGGPAAALRDAHLRHFTATYALGRMLHARGLRPQVVGGFSLGEWTAAALAGHLTPADCLQLLAARADALSTAPAGDLVVVRCDEGEVRELASTTGTHVAAAVGHMAWALGAGEAAVGHLVEQLVMARRPHRRLGLGIPYHTPLLSPVAERFLAAVEGLGLSTPADLEAELVPTLASGSGTAPPSSPEYWAAHLCQPIDLRRLASAVGEQTVVVELGDENGLARSVTDAAPRETLCQAVGLLAPTARGEAAPRSLLGTLARLWVNGQADVDLNTHLGDGGTFVVLPPTAFDREEYAAEPVARRGGSEPEDAGARLRRAQSTADWPYYPSWKRRRRHPAEPLDLTGQRWLVLANPGAFEDAFVELARRHGAEVVQLCEPGAGPAPGAREYHGSDPQAAEALLADLGANLRPVTRVVHLWCTDPITDGDFAHRTASVEAELDRGFYTLLRLLQRLAQAQGSSPVTLDLCTRGGHRLQAADDLYPGRALLQGPSRVIPQEMPFVSARTVEIGALLRDAAAAADSAREVFDELTQARDSAKAVALASREDRWVEVFERDTLPDNPTAERLPRRLRPRGVYMITGGLGGIGLTLAEYLAQEAQARLVLTGLHPFPARNEWEALLADPDTDGDLRARLERLMGFEALGAEVMAVRCDAADLDETRALVAEVEQRFGPLNGVVHAAGIFETQKAFRGIDETEVVDCRRRLLPKVNGTLVLAECLRGRSLDFILMQSSLSSQLGGLGFYAYTAGNAFMDAFTELHRSADLPWMSVNWDGWIFRERGDDPTDLAVISPTFASPSFGVVAEIAVRPSEGADVFARVLDLDRPSQVMISTADFDRRVRQWLLPAAEHTGAERRRGHDTAVKPRGEAVGVQYRAPSGPVEETVAAIWSELLGVDAVGVDDNFFVLGGDSLLGVQVMYEVGETFGVAGSVITLFEEPTVAALARQIETLTGQRGEGSPAGAG